MHNKSSKFAPVFIASTVVFFLGSALKFILSDKNQSKKPQSDTSFDLTQKNVRSTHDKVGEVGQVQQVEQAK